LSELYLCYCCCQSYICVIVVVRAIFVIVVRAIFVDIKLV
jgi:hypothetical protein